MTMLKDHQGIVQRNYFTSKEAIKVLDGILERMYLNIVTHDDIEIVFSIFIQFLVVWESMDDEAKERIINECEKRLEEIS